MFEPPEDEARRAEALQQAIFSSDNVSPHHPSYDQMTAKIVERAKEFEKWLKEGAEEPADLPVAPAPPRGAFGSYQSGGLDGGS